MNKGDKGSFDLGKLTGPGLLSAILLGFFIPGASVLKPALPWFLGALLYFSFIRLEFRLKEVLHGGLFLFPLMVWGILPPLIVLCGRTLSPEFFTGLFIVAVAPPALGAPVITELIHGDRKTALANTVLYNLLSPFAYAVLSAVWLSESGIRVPVPAILVNVFILVFVPLVLSLIARLSRTVVRVSCRLAPVFNPVGLMSIVFIAVATAALRIRAMPAGTILTVFGIVFTLSVVLYGSGFLFGRTFEKKKTYAVALGQKNTSLAVWIAVGTFSPLAAVPAVLYIVSHHLLASLMILVFRGRKKDRRSVKTRL
jgi:bile acid:Na+ symporter, BASS family